MTSDDVLVLAWLVLAHLVGDFVLQTDAMVLDKTSRSRRRAWGGLARHSGAVALCLVPFALAYGLRGAILVAVVALTHALIDRWKVRATRRAEARALAEAHGRHETTGGDGLGPAWTPLPGALFILDQLLHVAVICVAWAVLLAPVEPLAEWGAFVGQLAPADEASFHRGAMLAVVAASLVIVNVRAGALFVATLVRPRESVSAVPAVPLPPPERDRPTGWRVRVGRLVAHAEPLGRAAERPAATHAHAGHAAPARIGAAIGVLERLLIVTFVLTGSTAAIGFVVAAKTLARFKQLDDRDFAEYYLLGTLASVAVALGSALVAQAALASLGA